MHIEDTQVDGKGYTQKEEYAAQGVQPELTSWKRQKREGYLYTLIHLSLYFTYLSDSHHTASSRDDDRAGNQPAAEPKSLHT